MEATVEKVTDETLKEFFAHVEACESTEEKLRMTLAFMRETLAEEGSPRFRHFWEARKLCVPLFQEGVHPAIRSQLWEEFTEISKQARELKGHLDKASAFAVEQFELAVLALEAEVQEREERLAKIAPVTLPLRSEVLASRLSFYDPLQRELNLLNGWAARINGLRKELTGTAMRLRDKNRLFKRISTLGEQVFPRRRELVEQVSGAFVEDVDRFIDGAFSGGEAQIPPFRLRDEIKGLQAFAKVLTLSTRAFASSRERLSECWNRVRESDKEHKKEQAERRAAFKEQLDGLKDRIDEVMALEGEGPSKGLDQLGKEVAEWDIGVREKKAARELLGSARQTLFAKAKAEKEARAAASREAADAIRAEIEGVSEALTLDQLLAVKKELEEKIAGAGLLAVHRKELEQALEPLGDRMVEVEEDQLLSTPEGKVEVLKRRHERRTAVKGRIDELKRLKGGSGLDFEQALRYDQELHAEKEKLARLDAQIKELQ